MDYELKSWRQDANSSNLDLVVDIEPAKPNVVRKFRVEVTEDTLQLYRNQEKVLTWTLFDAVLDEPQWETKSDELHINLVKKSEELWKSALRNPLPPCDQELIDPTKREPGQVGPDAYDEAVVLTIEELDHLLAMEVASFDATQPSETRDTDASDPDAILEDVLSQKTGLSAKEREAEEEQKTLQHEMEKIERRLKELKEEAGEDAERKISIVQEMHRHCAEILELRQEPVTVQGLVRALQHDITKAKLNRGEDATESEPFANPSEEAMTPEELYVRGILALERGDPAEGLHFLRLAALSHDHTQSMMTLVRLYMESGLQTLSLQLLLDKSVRALDPLSNFTTAQMFDNGVGNFTPALALALYFYQRAASTGETSAMCFAAQLLLRGGCVATAGRTELCNLRLAARWMQHALDRGSCLAYKLMLERYLGGEGSGEGADPGTRKMYERLNEKPNYEKAKKYYTLLSDTSREILKQVPNVEQRLEALRKGEVGKPSSARKTEEEKGGKSEEAHPQLEIVPKPKVSSHAEERLQRFEPSSMGARSHMVKPRGFDPKASWGDRRQRMWEKVASASLLGAAAYILAFPVRVIALPTFFEFLETCLLSLPWNKSPRVSPQGLF